MRRLVFITRHNTWLDFIENSARCWPIYSRHARTFQSRVGEQILVYLARKSSIAGVIEITGEPQEMEPLVISRRKFDFAVPIEFKIILPEQKLVEVRPLINVLEYTKKHPETWGSRFQKSVASIVESDFQLLYSLVLDNYGV